MSQFIDNLKDLIGDTFEAIKEVIDIFKALYDLIVEFINFLPSPFLEMTLITASVFFLITIWRLRK